MELCFDKWRGVGEAEELFSSDIRMLVVENLTRCRITEWQSEKSKVCP